MAFFFTQITLIFLPASVYNQSIFPTDKRQQLYGKWRMTHIIFETEQNHARALIPKKRIVYYFLENGSGEISENGAKKGKFNWKIGTGGNLYLTEKDGSYKSTKPVKKNTYRIELITQFGLHYKKKLIVMDLATMLLRAAFNNNLKRIVPLIKRGAKIESRDENGRTPLHLASENGNMIMVKLLINQKANANLKDNYKRTARDLALSRGHTELADYLLKFMDKSELAKTEGKTTKGASKDGKTTDSTSTEAKKPLESEKEDLTRYEIIEDYD